MLSSEGIADFIHVVVIIQGQYICGGVEVLVHTSALHAHAGEQKEQVCMEAQLPGQLNTTCLHMHMHRAGTQFSISSPYTRFPCKL